MISLPSFSLPLPGAWLSVVCLLSLSISQPMLILPIDFFQFLSISPSFFLSSPFLCPIRHPPSGSCCPVPQWTPGGSQSRKFRPGSIHNANLAVIEEAVRFARTRSKQFLVIKVLCFSSTSISSVSVGTQVS